MRIGKKKTEIVIDSSRISLQRGEGGVVTVRAEEDIALAKGLGYTHAHDRLLQILFARVVAQGRITQYFFDTDEAFAVDVMIRKLGFADDLAADIENLSDDALAWASAYCAGLNTYLELFGPPRICKLLKMKVTPWTVADILLVTKMHIYLGLAQVQERSERFILQAVHDGVDTTFLKKLFSPHLDLLDEQMVHLIKKLRLECPYFDLQFRPGLSNNWAISGSKSISGKPMSAADPHLQVNRLPAIWYEVILESDDDYRMGISTPGVPGIVMGRSRCLTASFTYGMMDTIDLFIEEIQGGRCRREGEWETLKMREEIIERKNKGPLTLRFFESSSGVIERKDNAQESLEDGVYTSLAWSGAKKGASPNLNALAKLWSATTVEEAGKIAREISLPCNWVLADSQGGIAYQQSGRLPKRVKTGLMPLPAWERANLWQGFVDSRDLSATYNPPSGFVSSANEDKNQHGKPISITIPYSHYRQERIERFLSEDRKFTLQDMQTLQCDLLSLQARAFLDTMRHLIPPTPVGDLLKHWDCCYTVDSQGAYLFEAFYFTLLQEVFGKVFGREAWDLVATRHSLVVFTHAFFDRILLGDDESWFGSEGKTACFKRNLQSVCDAYRNLEVPQWGQENSFIMYNLYFNGKLPKFLKFDIGPLKMGGSRATVAASFVFQEKSRIFAAAASYRLVTDMATDSAETILAGGPSDSRLSRYYASDIKKWINYQYKTIKASS